MSLKYDVVVFDMDGTLIDTDLMLVSTMLFLFAKYDSKQRLSLTKLLNFSGPPLEVSFAKTFPNDDTKMLIDEFREKSKQNYERLTSLYPDSFEVIKKLHEQGIRLAIFTSKQRIATLETLAMFNLMPYFDYVVSYEDVIHAKPHPEGLNKCLSFFNIPKERMLFIGDTSFDYYAAKEAHVDVALALWSLRKFDNNIKPTYWLKDYLHILEMIKNE